jgi:hypothetical protein
VLAYLERHGIPFTHVTAESAEGQDLIDRYRLRASPGILVDGVSISPFDLLIPPACQVDEDAAQRAFGAARVASGEGNYSDEDPGGADR